MPTLKMYISGQLVDTLPISFAGLEKEERPAHVEGLSQWMLKKNYVEPGLTYEIFLDEVGSAVNEILKKEKALENKTAPEAGKAIREDDGRKKPAKMKNIRKPIPVYDPVPLPIQHVKGQYSNKQWWEE